MVDLIAKIDALAVHIRAGFVTVFHALEHEVSTILATLVNLYGPEVVAHAIATHKAGIELYADREVDLGATLTKALVQSTIVERFGLPPTAAQFIAGGITHLFAVGESKVNALIDAGAAKLEAQTGAPSTP